MKILKNTIIALFILVMAVAVLLPFAWMISVSFRPDNEVMRFPPTIFGGVYTLDIYPEFFKRVQFLHIFGNTFFISIVVALGSAITSALAGFGFAKYDFKGKNLLFYALMGTIMIPIFVILIPLYLVMLKLNWLDSYFALIVPFLASPIGIFLMRQFIYGIPDDLINASRIDGCSEYRIFGSIIIPSVLPALASLVILTFMQQWDSLLWPAIITSSEQMRVLTVELTQLSRENNASTNWNLTMVGGVLSSIPIVIMYLFMQRYFISSITMTGIKD